VVGFVNEISDDFDAKFSGREQYVSVLNLSIALVMTMSTI
jgi:hypothetical protein